MAAKSKIAILGEKETFLIRVLRKKLAEKNINSDFVSWNVNEMETSLKGAGVIALYTNDNDLPADAALTFLKDKAVESNIPILFIGDVSDLKYVKKLIPGDIIYKSFQRPLDTEEFSNALNELFSRDTSSFKTILIVDDDPGYLALVREWIKDTYKVFAVTSGMQAIKWLGKNSADLILLDYEMPVTNGPQVLEMLRSDAETKTIPVIFLTGKGDKESVMAVVSLRPDGYFLKTIKKDELRDKLKEFFILRR